MGKSNEQGGVCGVLSDCVLAWGMVCSSLSLSPFFFPLVFGTETERVDNPGQTVPSILRIDRLLTSHGRENVTKSGYRPRQALLCSVLVASS